MENPEQDKQSLETLREQVIDTLTSHFSREHLGMEEFEKRVDLVNAAKNRVAMAMVLSDLPDLPPGTVPAIKQKTTPAARPALDYSLNPEPARDQEQLFCLFSGQNRGGVWKPAVNTTATCIFGGISMDLTRAQLPPEGIRIRVLSLFGGLDVKIPRGVRVQAQGIGIFGGFDNSCDAGDDLSAPLIRVEGLALFGGVSLSHPRKKKKAAE